ncbi:MAG TPA: hypothetical protein VIJ65_07425 [Acidobacteriaceae bacterium]
MAIAEQNSPKLTAGKGYEVLMAFCMAAMLMCLLPDFMGLIWIAASLSVIGFPHLSQLVSILIHAHFSLGTLAISLWLLRLIAICFSMRVPSLPLVAAAAVILGDFCFDNRFDHAAGQSASPIGSHVLNLIILAFALILFILSLLRNRAILRSSPAGAAC